MCTMRKFAVSLFVLGVMMIPLLGRADVDTQERIHQLQIIIAQLTEQVQRLLMAQSRGQGIRAGDTVVATSNLNVRVAPSRAAGIMAEIETGTRGAVKDGPVVADGYTWWKIAYVNWLTGWSVQNWLEKVFSGTSETPLPIPPPNISIPRIIADTLPAAIPGEVYDVQVTGSGGMGSYDWGITAGELPAGLTLVQGICTGSGCQAPVNISGIVSPAAPYRAYNFTLSLTAQGAVATKSFSITVSPTGTANGPVISAITPAAGPIGTRGIITGMNFSPVIDFNITTPDGFTQAVNALASQSSTAIGFEVPPAVNGNPTQPGIYTFSVTTENGTSNTAQFTVIGSSGSANVAITNMSSSHGPIGTRGTISGRGFTASTNTFTVVFPNGTQATVPNLIRTTATEMPFEVPAMINGVPIITGTYIFWVTNENGTSNSFTFTVTDPITQGVSGSFIPARTNSCPQCGSRWPGGGGYNGFGISCQLYSSVCTKMNGTPHKNRNGETIPWWMKDTCRAAPSTPGC